MVNYTIHENVGQGPGFNDGASLNSFAPVSEIKDTGPDQIRFNLNQDHPVFTDEKAHVEVLTQHLGNGDLNMSMNQSSALPTPDKIVFNNVKTRKVRARPGPAETAWEEEEVSS